MLYGLTREDVKDYLKKLNTKQLDIMYHFVDNILWDRHITAEERKGAAKKSQAPAKRNTKLA